MLQRIVNNIIPSVLVVNNLNWTQNVQEFCDHYRQDIPNAAGFDAELQLWERMWRDQQALLPSSIRSWFFFHVRSVERV